ncbi:TPA: ead/Ea22-like family protein [Vibrio parahaemolyticus]|nr:ead/Ea22-like family protein [Vibrio parahaemolyticus]HAV1982847.1 ead/Ea22-like family protein [Vibrio parahaemolyticus]
MKEQASNHVEVPDFLLEMSRQMHEQDNRSTRDPIWQVKYRTHLVTEEDYNESHWEIVDTEEGITLFHSKHDSDFDGLFEHLFDCQPDWLIEWAEQYANMDVKAHDGDIEGDSYDALLVAFQSHFDPNVQELPDSLKKFHMQEVEVVVKTCLTEADANAFIKRKQHDYPKLYTYVESMVFCPQMIQLRDWILSLTPPAGASNDL